MFRSTVRLVALAAFAAAPLAAQPAASAPAGRSAAKAVMEAADKGRILGREGAPVWVVVMSDFQCPYCKRWHDDTDARLRKAYVETGKVRVAFLNFPLPSHRQAMPTAEAAMCAAAQGKFWPMHDAIFAAQQSWSGKDDAVATTIDGIARSLNLDVAAFNTCRSERQTRMLVEEDRRRGESAGVQGTPAFYVGSQFVSGAIPPAEFFRILDAELAKAAPAKN